MKGFLLLVARHPVLSLIALLLSFPVAGYYGSKVIQDASVDGLIIQDEEKEYYDSIKEIFGDDTLVTVLIKSPDGIFQDAILETIKNVTDSAFDVSIGNEGEEIPVITHVTSLTTVNKILNKDGYLDTDKLMDYLPADEEELEEVKSNTVRSELLYDNVISKDLTATAVNIYLSAQPENVLNYNQQVTVQIEEILKEERSKLADLGIDAEIIQIGMPTVKTELAVLIERDMSVLVPAALVIIFGILWVAFRSPIAVLLPLFTGVLSVIGCLAFMTLMGYTINLITNIIPLLLLVIGCTEDIHMLADYKHQVRHEKDKNKAIRNMLIKCSLAVFLTSVTTALGFLTLKLNPIRMLQEFGAAATVGLVMNYFITIVAVPTLLRLTPVPKHFRDEEKKSPTVARIAKWLFHVAVNYRLRVVCVTTVVVALSIIGCFKIKVDADLVSFFKPSNSVRQQMKTLEENLSGGQSFQVIVNTEGMGGEEGIKEPVTLRAMDELEQYLRERFDYVVSVADYIKVFNREFNGGEENFKIPDTFDEVSQMLLLLESNEMQRIMGPDYQNASIVVRHHVYGSWQLTEELELLRAKVDEIFPKGVEVRFTGEGILFNKASDTMAVGQVTSLGFAVLIIFIIISILFVSPKAGLLAMIPNGIPILMNFGIMGWFGMSLNPGTCTVAVIALGIAIDDTIHLMVQFYKELKIDGDQKGAMQRTLDSELMPVLSSSVALGLGFSALILADVVSSVQFGYLACFAMMNALLSDLLVAPALLISTRLISSWDLLKIRINESTIKDSALFKNMKLSELKKIVLLGVLQEFKAGETIVKQGSNDREMYLILEGEAKVAIEQSSAQEAHVGHLSRGDIFGEIAFITGEKRTANVLAVEPVTALRIDDKSLQSVKDRFPKIGAKLFFNLSNILGQRLKQTTSAWTAERE